MKSNTNNQIIGLTFLIGLSLAYYVYFFSGSIEGFLSLFSNPNAHSQKPASVPLSDIIVASLLGIALMRTARVSWLSSRIANEYTVSGVKKHDKSKSIEQPSTRFTLLIPARNETRVIENTMTQISRVDYQAQLYDVVVIADAREGSRSYIRTTDIAKQHAALLNQKLKREVFHVVEVPDSFDGNLRRGGKRSMRSTKGRALNYGLLWLCTTSNIRTTDYIGVLDADDRLHPEALAQVAALARGSNPEIIQGPVLRISNLARADLTGIMAGIELSLRNISRLWLELNSREECPRFLAGSNYFVKPALIVETGGWCSESLVENAMLSLQLYLKNKTHARWLPAYAIEQTPPSWSTYLKQKEKWASGHLQLLPLVASTNMPWAIKLQTYLKIVLQLIESPIDNIVPLISLPLISHIWLHQLSHIDGQLGRQMAIGLILAIALISIYTWSHFSRGLLLLNPFSPSPLAETKLRLTIVLLTFCMPALAILQLIPRCTALIRFMTDQENTEWHEINRSKETIENISLNP